MSEVHDDQHPLDPTDHVAQLEGVLQRVSTSDRVVDLGAGLGRIGRPLAECGCEVVAVDHDPGVLAAGGWVDHPSVRPIVEDMLAPEATWHREGPYDVALCLGNTLALLLAHHDLDRLFERIASCLTDSGVLLVDDFPLWAWESVHAGDWPTGVSEDGQAQILWLPGEPAFAFRTGDAVDPAAEVPDEEERLLRLWSMSELGHLSRNHGLGAPTHHPEPNLLQFDRL